MTRFQNSFLRVSARSVFSSIVFHLFLRIFSKLFSYLLSLFVPNLDIPCTVADERYSSTILCSTIVIQQLNRFGRLILTSISQDLFPEYKQRNHEKFKILTNDTKELTNVYFPWVVITCYCHCIRSLPHFVSLYMTNIDSNSRRSRSIRQMNLCI